MSKPKVSVIIPTWNRQEHLANTVASVLRQTEQNFEILIIDDASEQAMAERVITQLRDARINYIRQPEHRGVGAARNAGIARAKAPYVAFLDDDDEWLPEKLEAQLDVLEACPPTVAGVYTARLTAYHETGEVIVQRFPVPFSAWRGNVITTSSLLVRRGCFDVVGTFDERLTAGGDWDMWLRIAACYEFRYIDRVLVKYLVHRHSIEGNPLRHAPSRELILMKHAQVFRQAPRSYAARYQRLAVLYHSHGEPEKARHALLKALRIWPFAIRLYWRLLVFGIRSFRAGATQTALKVSKRH